MKCIKCNRDNKIKDGLIRGKQRYRCKNCNYRFTVERRSSEKPLELKQKALRLYLEGLGIRAIGRVLNINFVTVYYWIKKFGESMEFPDSSDSSDSPEVVELDEIHSYVGRKKTTAGAGSPLTEKEKNSWTLPAAKEILPPSGNYGTG